MFALDWISRAFTGHSIEQIEGSRLCRIEYDEAIDRVTRILQNLSVCMWRHSVEFHPNGADVYLSDRALWVVNHDAKAGELWANYLSLSGSANGFGGTAPTSTEPLYCQAYANAYTIRSSYGLSVPNVNPDFIAYWLHRWRTENWRSQT